jgi:methyltransferase family protein
MTEELRGESDPGLWGASLANLLELLVPLLDAVEAGSVAEVGAFAGDLTQDLVAWAERADSRVVAIDPTPQRELITLSTRSDRLELVREPSTAAIPGLPEIDVVIIDGDHNYFTVSEELRLIDERYAGGQAPLLILHDVCWPHGRRDAYYSPERIPEAGRQPMVEGGAIFPGEAGIAAGGLPYKWVAEREGGPRNGVMTAVEDFVEGRENVRLAIVPAFFGLGVVWRLDAPWAGRVADVIAHWDSNPIVARLETNRVYHLAREHAQRPELDRLRAQNRQKTELLESLMGSRAFRFADSLSRLRNPRRARSWRDDARRVIDED